MILNAAWFPFTFLTIRFVYINLFIIKSFNKVYVETICFIKPVLFIKTQKECIVLIRKCVEFKARIFYMKTRYDNI